MLREAYEETGCSIVLERFLLETDVTFEGEHGTIEWNSYVFQARYLSGDFQFTDHEEIREVRLASLKDFQTFSAIMRQTDVAGLHYRAALHEAVEKLL